MCLPRSAPSDRQVHLHHRREWIPLPLSRRSTAGPHAMSERPGAEELLGTRLRWLGAVAIMQDRSTPSHQLLVMIVLLLAASAGVVFFYWLPKRRAAERADDEKSARSALVTLSTAEADFRMNDRDRNGV